MTQFLPYWSVSSEAICAEARDMGLTVTILSEEKNLFEVSNTKQKVLFKSTDFGGNSALGLKISDDKELTNIVLEKEGFPIPKSAYMSREEFTKSESLLKDFDFPVVIKPLNESSGNGVQIGIQTPEELRIKLERAFERYPRMIIQEQISGDECRVLVFRDTVLVAMIRIPPKIVGDGHSTIEELIFQENCSNTLR